MKAPLPALLSILLLSSGLAACGQTGPLHHPESAPAKEHYLIYRRPSAPPAAAVPVDAAPTSTGPAADPVPPDAVSPDGEAPNSKPRPLSP